MLDSKPRMSAADYSPVFTFVISFFVFHFFDWQDATYFVLSVLISLLTYIYEAHLLKEERDLTRQNLKKAGFHTGLLTLQFLLVFAVAFLHWYRVIPMAWRMGLLLVMVILYMVILFRAINTLYSIRLQSPKK